MSESKQRWRLVFARDEEARYLSHLDAIHLWERALRRGRIPIAMSEGFSPRPRLIFGAPLPLGMLAEHEPADLFVSERLTRREMRLRLTAGMPRGYRLMDLHDAWVGAPALATELVAADYRMTVLGAEAGRLRCAAEALFRAERLPRQKRREKKVTAYDLRPLLLALHVREAAEEAGARTERAVAAGAPVAAAAPAADIWMRLRHSQDLGSGRPEEVVSALGDELGLAVLDYARADSEAPDGVATAEPEDGGQAAHLAPDPVSGALLEIVRPVRERLWLVGEAPVDATGLAP